MNLRGEKIRVGEFLMWFRRYLWYIQTIIFGVNALASMTILKWSLWWLLLLIPISVLVVILDILAMGPGEFSAGMRRNPDWKELRKDVDAIKQKLGIE